MHDGGPRYSPLALYLPLACASAYPIAPHTSHTRMHFCLQGTLSVLQVWVPHGLLHEIWTSRAGVGADKVLISEAQEQDSRRDAGRDTGLNEENID